MGLPWVDILLFICQIDLLLIFCRPLCLFRYVYCNYHVGESLLSKLRPLAFFYMGISVAHIHKRWDAKNFPGHLFKTLAPLPHNTLYLASHFYSTYHHLTCSILVLVSRTAMFSCILFTTPIKNFLWVSIINSFQGSFFPWILRAIFLSSYNIHFFRVTCYHSLTRLKKIYSSLVPANRQSTWCVLTLFIFYIGPARFPSLNMVLGRMASRASSPTLVGLLAPSKHGSCGLRTDLHLLHLVAFPCWR